MENTNFVEQHASILRRIDQVTTMLIEDQKKVHDAYSKILYYYVPQARTLGSQVGLANLESLFPHQDSDSTRPPLIPEDEDPVQAIVHLNELVGQWCKDLIDRIHLRDIDFSSKSRSLYFTRDGRYLVHVDYKKVELGSDWGAKVSPLYKIEFEHGVSTIAFSPDKETMSVAVKGSSLHRSLDGYSIKIVSIFDHNVLFNLRGHVDTINQMIYSPDGRLLVSVSDDKTVRIWDIPKHRGLATLKGHEDKVENVVFSADGQLLATSDERGTIKIWSLAKNREVQSFKPQFWNLQSHPLSFSGDKKYLWIGGDPLYCWDLQANKSVMTRRAQGGEKIFMIENGKYFVLERSSLSSLIWDAATYQPVLEAHGIFSPTDKNFASNSTYATFNTPSQLIEPYVCIGQSIKEAEKWQKLALEKINRVFTDQMQSLAQNDFPIHNQLYEQVHPALKPWSDASWKTNQPLNGSNKSDAMLLGSFSLQAPGFTPFKSITLIPFPRTPALLFEGSRDLVLPAIQSLLARATSLTKPNLLRFLFIDPVSLGQNAAPFMKLADYDERLVSGKAWSEPNHIEQQLGNLCAHVENVIQNLLRVQFKDIVDYNAAAGEIAEAYRLLVIYDFPSGFSETAAHRLLSLVQNGPRCGVYPIIHIDPTKPMPYGFDLDELKRSASLITQKEDKFTWDVEPYQEGTIELDFAPEPDTLTNLLDQLGTGALASNKVEVPFQNVSPDPGQWWQASSQNKISIPLGPTGARKIQTLELGQGTAQHALIAGKTGSGKSTLFHTLITNAALLYSPDEVQFYLIDFKKGVEFKTYAAHSLPHARVIAIESEREFGLSVLQGLGDEIRSRGDLFRKAGADHITDYRQKTGHQLARLLLVVDEFQEFFTENDTIAGKAAQILDRLVRQGRAFGIHVILGSQTLAGAYSLARSTMDQIAIRIALQSSETDSRLILADDNPAARLLTRPGEAIYNNTNGLVEGNTPFQVAWLPDKTRDELLSHVNQLALSKTWSAEWIQVVFEGNAPAKFEQNRAFFDLLKNQESSRDLRQYRGWLGEPMAISDAVFARFRRQSANNLLVVGQNEETAKALFAAEIASLLAQLPKNERHAALFLLDFSSVDSAEGEYLHQLSNWFPEAVNYGRRRQLSEFLVELEKEIQTRLNDETSHRPALFLFLFGLQRARDLRLDDSIGFSSFDASSDPDLTKLFSTILREGPDLGVFSLVWCDTLTNLNRSIDRRSLREFALRVALQMNADDSSQLIGIPAASKLGSYQGLFYDEDDGTLVKFRPYILPSPELLKKIGGFLQNQG